MPAHMNEEITAETEKDAAVETDQPIERVIEEMNTQNAEKAIASE